MNIPYDEVYHLIHNLRRKVAEDEIDAETVLNILEKQLNKREYEDFI